MNLSELLLPEKSKRDLCARTEVAMWYVLAAVAVVVEQAGIIYWRTVLV